MSVQLPYLKGVRTRFRNSLQKEVDSGNRFLETDHALLPPTEAKDLRLKVSECREKIELYTDKVCTQSEKIALAVGNEDDSLIQKIIFEDSEESEVAMSVYFKLKSLESVLKEHEVNGAKMDESKVTPSMSEEMNKLFEHQLKLQKDFLDSQRDKDKASISAVKLPKLDINSFNGNKLYFTEFWDSFTSAIHSNSKLSGVEKFSYLRSKLTGEARSAISGLSLTNENYSIAINILKERYGDKQEMIDLHYKQMIDLPPVKNTTGSLRYFLDKIEKHLRSLQVLHQDIEQDLFVSIIKRKLPPDVLLQLEIQKGAGNKWTVTKLRNLLNEFITAKEASEKNTLLERKNDRQVGPIRSPVTGWNSSQRRNGHPGFRQSHNGATGTPFKRSVYNGASNGTLLSNEKCSEKASSNRTKCRYCDKAHWSDECDVFKTVEDRKQKIKGSCYRCLKEGHMSNECKSIKSCVYCGEANVHHRSLCQKKFASKKKAEGAHFCSNNAAQNNPDTGDYTGEESGLLSYNESVLMQTATTEVKSPEKEKGEMVRLLLDSGSHRTYVTEHLVKRLKLKGDIEQEIQLVTFGTENSKTIKTKTTKLQIKLKDGKFMTLTANIVPTITGAISRKTTKFTSTKKFKDLTQDLTMADSIPMTDESITLDLLVGNDYYLDITEMEKIEVQAGLYLLSSRLGWILTGRTFLNEERNSTHSDMNMLILTEGSNSIGIECFSKIDDTVSIQPKLEDFWSLEALGITDRPERSDDKTAVTNFKDTIKFENGRYAVTWPWRSEFPDLSENRGLALGRLRSLSVRLQRQPDLLQRYDSIIRDQCDKGIIEKVDRNHAEGMKHYIPHHVVVKPDNSTTKLRVVYDASAKTSKEHKSLNENLYRGPVLLRNLCGILMRFRLHKIGITSDIEKAFLQVELQVSERDVTRFLWFKNLEYPDVRENNIQEYRFCRVPFGIISSPYLLSATIEHHLDSYNSSLSTQLKENIYMDNVITGKDTVEEAIELYKGAKSMFSEASMNLREWMTNDPKVNEQIPLEDRAKDSGKVLGHTWDVKEDTLSINKVKALSKDLKVTKRNVLKLVASVFDPLGLFSPVTMRGKVLIQRIWSQKLDWDDALDDECSKEWTEIKSDLEKIECVKLDRCIVSGNLNSQTKYSLVCFADASKKAYASAVYLIQEDEIAMKSNLIFAKSRLAPVKGISIPRLELMAVVIGTRSLKFVESQLKLSVKDMFLMTDSMCVLQWLSSEKTLPVFIQNRVKEIKSNEGIKFRFVNSQNNSADIASRGCTTQTLCNDKMWWQGPTNLREVIFGENCATDESEEINQEDILSSKGCKPKCDHVVEAPEETEYVCTGVEAADQNSPLGDVQKYSSASRLIRVTAWCLRFINKIKKKTNEKGCLKCEELDEAEQFHVKFCQRKHFADVISSIVKGKPNNLAKQLDIFIDENGLLRCMGRLKHANLCEAARVPILLPQRDTHTNMLIDKEHKRILHSGVSQTLNSIRMKYWIPHGRATVRSRLKQCKVCKRVDGGPYKLPTMAPLPKSRVTDATPFSRVGIDYMGPLFIKENNVSAKVWICLFSCLVTRAIHLELVQDMSSSTFILCLRRFIATRGTPREIISDNAKQFILTSETIPLIWKTTIHNNDVQDYVSQEGITWIFNVELAPWMGGFYERMVGIVKKSLRKTIGKKLLTLDQMQTVIKEVEAVVNQRPLVYVGDDIGSSIVITPGHFLCLNPLTGIPETDNEDEDDPTFRLVESSAEKLLKLWKKGEKLLNSFWKLWQGEYLLSLRERSQKTIKTRKPEAGEFPQTGDVVLIKDDLPRGQWKLGKINRLRISRDGQIRSAEVITASKRILNRPLNLLYPIEVQSESVKHQRQECSDNGNPESSGITDKRPKRKAAERATNLLKHVV